MPASWSYSDDRSQSACVFLTVVIVAAAVAALAVAIASFVVVAFDYWCLETGTFDTAGILREQIVEEIATNLLPVSITPDIPAEVYLAYPPGTQIDTTGFIYYSAAPLIGRDEIYINYKPIPKHYGGAILKFNTITRIYELWNWYPGPFAYCTTAICGGKTVVCWSQCTPESCCEDFYRWY